MFLELRPGHLIEPLTGRRWDPEQITYQLFQRIAFYQNQGMSRNDRIFVHHGNKLEFFADLAAAWSLGACVIPIDPRLTQFEVETLAAAATPRFSLWHGGIDESIAATLAGDVNVLDTSDLFSEKSDAPPLVQSNTGLSLDDAALILFTSGTTGQPKGVVHTHRSLRARWISLRQSLGIEKFRRTLCLLPTHFGHGLICNCLFPWLSGQDLFLVPPFKPDTVMRLGHLLDQHEISFMSSVPLVWRLALKMAKPPESGKLERVFCGSAPLSAYLWREIQKWSGTPEVFNSYGITETGSWVAGTSIGDFEPQDGLIGEPWGAVVKILKSADTDKPMSLLEECSPGESGYVWLNTPPLMKGYYGRDDLTSQVVKEGWFMTGDIGVVDDRGYLYLRGREREEINKGGTKVYPGDIDAVVERFSDVADVCCFGYDDDPFYGQNVGVAVVLKKNSDRAIADLYGWARQHLAKYQMPVRWYIVDEIPRTSRGKMNRAKVSETCSSLHPIDLKRLLKKQ